MKRQALATTVIAIAMIGIAVGSLFAYRHQMLLTRGIVTFEDWPSELKSLAQKAGEEGDLITDIDVRRLGVATYFWQMPATVSQVALHTECFHLIRVANDGVERACILSRFPYGWKPPTHDEVDVYAFPRGFAGTDDGEFEFVMLHDRSATTIYFYYYFNF